MGSKDWKPKDRFNAEDFIKLIQEKIDSGKFAELYDEYLKERYNKNDI
ncbi:hypothetical protein M0R19_06285 [Candidatus Pacearchaeota archaeon]|jgi:hypothetical protein|nr:hypothetical protein [Candidatus Pacearchaeota archaeon]